MPRARSICSQPCCPHLQPCPVHPRPSRWAGRQERGGSRQERGYGSAHEQMRARLAREEPGCRVCGDSSRPWVAEHLVPKAEGGTDDRSNYARVCVDCAARKTALEGARARA